MFSKGTEMTKPRHVLSWRVQAEKVRREMDGMNMGEKEQKGSDLLDIVRIWKQWEVTE